MSEITYTDVRLQSCKHPRLKEALMFPQVSYAPRPVAASAPEPKPELSEEPGLGGLFAQKTLEVVFWGLGALSYPLKKLGGGAFASHRVTLPA